ncbi:MAG: M56 family metallopeptidase, partial [Planctomycetota bacterium]
MVPATPPIASADKLRAVLAAALVVWGIGVVLLFARLAYGWAVLMKLRRELEPIGAALRGEVLQRVHAALGTDALPPIKTSDRVGNPISVGVFRPIVILSANLAGALSRDELADVLTHECAHVLHRDHLVGLLQRLAGAIWWPLPLVPALNRRLAAAREGICDNYVLRRADPHDYARTLVDLAEKTTVFQRMPATVGLIHPRWRMDDRIAGILDTQRRLVTRVNTWAAVGVAALFLAAAVVVAGCRMREADEAAQPDRAPAEEGETQPSRPLAEYSMGMVNTFIYLENGRMSSCIKAYVWMDENRRPRVAALHRRTRFGEWVSHTGGPPPVVVECRSGEGSRLWVGGKEIIPADDVQCFVREDDGPVLRVNVSVEQLPIFQDVTAASEDQMQEWWDHVVVRTGPGAGTLQKPADGKIYFFENGMAGGAPLLLSIDSTEGVKAVDEWLKRILGNPESPKGAPPIHGEVFLTCWETGNPDKWPMKRIGIHLADLYEVSDEGFRRKLTDEDFSTLVSVFERHGERIEVLPAGAKAEPGKSVADLDMLFWHWGSFELHGPKDVRIAEAEASRARLEEALDRYKGSRDLVLVMLDKRAPLEGHDRVRHELLRLLLARGFKRVIVRQATSTRSLPVVFDSAMDSVPPEAEGAAAPGEADRGTAPPKSGPAREIEKLNGIASDGDAPRAERAAAVFELWKRHVRPGVGVNGIRDAFTDVGWVREAYLQEIRVLGGWIPVSLRSGHSVFRIYLFPVDDRGWSD